MWRLFTIAFVFLVFCLSPCQAKDKAKEQEFLVTKVIDGDTVMLENGNTVHYLGVDAPRARSKEGGSEFFAREAFRQNKRLVLLKKVRLEFDVEKKDRNGNLLAYVYVKNLFVNGEMIRLGFARCAVVSPNVRYKDLFQRYEKEASARCAGLWQEGKKESEAYYTGNKRTYVFHRPACPLAGKIPEKNRIIFRNRTDPIQIGYMPCKKCRP
jgi:micrococcal nuclease